MNVGIPNDRFRFRIALIKNKEMKNFGILKSGAGPDTSRCMLEIWHRVKW